MSARHPRTSIGCSRPECELQDALNRVKLIPCVVAVIVTIVILAMCFSGLTGEASFYNEGSKTASGEPFNKDAMTCARPGRQYLGHVYRVTNTQNGKSVVVRCNDVGPARWTGRIIDLSESAFRKIADTSKGHVPVRVRRIK